ncbi:MAG TPA: dCTP deaminase [bacterium]|nr:dCTP deaminase [bacterium]
MILSDGEIIENMNSGGITIFPFNKPQLQPASYDLTLSNTAWRQTPDIYSFEVDNPPETFGRQIKGFEQLYVYSGDFVLVSTREKIHVPNNMCARIEGKSSLGRLGLVVHATAGFIDPNFTGHLTLELFNVGKHGLILTPGMRISQISFFRLGKAAERPYGHKELGSRYQNQADRPVPYIMENY